MPFALSLPALRAFAPLPGMNTNFACNSHQSYFLMVFPSTRRRSRAAPICAERGGVACFPRPATQHDSRFHPSWLQGSKKDCERHDQARCSRRLLERLVGRRRSDTRNSGPHLRLRLLVAPLDEKIFDLLDRRFVNSETWRILPVYAAVNRRIRKMSEIC